MGRAPAPALAANSDCAGARSSLLSDGPPSSDGTTSSCRHGRADLPSSVRPTLDDQLVLVQIDEQEAVLPIIDQQHVEGEPALAQAADDVIRAKLDIRELLRGDTTKTWTIREIQDRIDGWSGTIVSLALMDLRRSSEIVMTEDLGIRVLALHDE